MAAVAKGDAKAALECLKQAAALDPKMTKAYFAIGSIADTWCGVDDGDPLCQVAIDGYQKAAALEPSREETWKRLAHASYLMNRIDQAESGYRRALSLDANDPEVLGGLAALDMEAAYRDVASTKIEHKAVTERALIGAPFCEQVREKNLALANEGIEFAAKAHEMKEKNVDLMGILGVLYATRAQIQCRDLKSFKDDMGASKRWYRLRTKTPHQALDQYLWNMPPGPPPAPPSRHWWEMRPAPK